MTRPEEIFVGGFQIVCSAQGCDKDLPDNSSSYCDQHRERGEAHDKMIASIWWRRALFSMSPPTYDDAQAERLFEKDWAELKTLLAEMRR